MCVQFILTLQHASFRHLDHAAFTSYSGKGRLYVRGDNKVRFHEMVGPEECKASFRRTDG